MTRISQATLSAVALKQIEVRVTLRVKDHKRQHGAMPSDEVIAAWLEAEMTEAASPERRAKWDAEMAALERK
jgi:hypothetical protein